MTAVADIDPQPAIECGLNHRVNIALAIDEPAGVARERMSKDVTGAEQGKHTLQNGVDVLAVGAALRKAPKLTKMNIDRQIRTAPNLGSHLNDADAPAREAANLGMRLDAANEIAVGDRSLHGRVDVDAIGPIEVRIMMSFQPADEIGREEGVSARLRLLGNEVPEAG
jgi:hypothetical protein